MVTDGWMFLILLSRSCFHCLRVTYSILLPGIIVLLLYLELLFIFLTGALVKLLQHVFVFRRPHYGVPRFPRHGLKRIILLHVCVRLALKNCFLYSTAPTLLVPRKTLYLMEIVYEVILHCIFGLTDLKSSKCCVIFRNISRNNILTVPLFRTVFFLSFL